MAQPEFVPTGGQVAVRPETPLPTPEGWSADRPAELVAGQSLPTGRGFGSPGPDQGFALGLFRRFKDGVTLHATEHWSDVVAGCLGVANARASIYGRAPMVHDVRLALYTFGFLGDAPQDLVEWRTALFAEASHHYQVQRQIVSLVSPDTLRLSPEQVGAVVRGGQWQSLFVA
jgi:hypothetical protein